MLYRGVSDWEYGLIIRMRRAFIYKIKPYSFHPIA